MTNSLLAMLLLCFLIFSCEKEVFDQYGYYGKGTALLNGIPYEAGVGTFIDLGICKPDTCIAINIVRRNKYGERRADITLGIIPFKTGKFEIYYEIPGSNHHEHYELTYSEQSDGGDVVTGFYKTFQQDTANWINIKKMDLKTGDVEGTFQATVARRTSSGNIPDTIKITDGSFIGKINWNK